MAIKAVATAAVGGRSFDRELADLLAARYAEAEPGDTTGLARPRRDLSLPLPPTLADRAAAQAADGRARVLLAKAAERLKEHLSAGATGLGVVEGLPQWAAAGANLMVACSCRARCPHPRRFV